MIGADVFTSGLTADQKIQWLSRYRDNEREIARLLNERIRKRSLAERVTQSFDTIPGGGEGGRIPDAVEALVQIDADLDAELQKCRAVRLEITDAINRVRAHDLRQLLRFRYLSGYTFERIAEEMERSTKWVGYRHADALEEIVL